MTVTGIITIAGYLTKLVSLGVEVSTIIRVGQAALNKMVADNRDPTNEELDAIRSRLIANDEAIQRA